MTGATTSCLVIEREKVLLEVNAPYRRLKKRVLRSGVVYVKSMRSRIYDAQKAAVRIVGNSESAHRASGK